MEPPAAELRWLGYEWDSGTDPMWLVAAAGLVTALAVPSLLGCMLAPPGAEHLIRSAKQRVALVVAHPDDEVMFFWPTLLNLQSAGSALCVLCLSTGNADGLGATRVKEMRKSCESVGVRGDDLLILDEPQLQDGFHSWPVEVVSAHVLDFINRRKIDTVITFDKGGVSGHPNHISTNMGVCHAQGVAAADADAKTYCLRVFMLQTLGLPLKYLGPLGLLPTTTGPCCSCWNPLASLRALAVHWSQLVWYRVLFALFSRYAYANFYTEYGAPPVTNHTEAKKVD